ncbi:MAG: hypothetical protein ACFBSE_14700, partial [Prochloraceae cyanobacterium]
RMRTKKLFLVLLFLVSCCLQVYISPLAALPNPQPEVIVQPDWNNVSFASLPPITSPGLVNAPASLIEQLGYNPSRAWQIGDRAADILKIGDFSPTELPDFALSTVSSITGIEISTLTSLSLDKFSLMEWQNWDSLISAIPDLGGLPISRVKIAKDFFGELNSGDLPTDLSIMDAIGFSGSGQIKLSQVLNLSEYQIADVPLLEITQIDSFLKWQESFISGIPGLKFVSFGSFIDFFSTQTARVDWTWSDAEHGSPTLLSERFTSGSAIRGKVTPKKCPPAEPSAYIELTNAPTSTINFVGQRIATSSQKVEGGYGILKYLNGGLEPTGFLPFGKFAKVAIDEIIANEGIATLALYFNVCGQPWVDSCSSYFIGGFPLFTVREKDLLVISGVSSPKNLNIPSNLARIKQELLNRSGIGYSGSREVVYSDIPAGEINQNILNTALNSKGMPTGNGYSPAATENGRLACAWAVNQVLIDAGIRPLGKNQLHVLSIEADLKNGRGVAVNPVEAQPGDLVIVDVPGTNRQHIGICLDNGCDRAISNSSGNASFSWISDGHFSSSYSGARRAIYRVVN